jgi:hypothetical protein
MRNEALANNIVVNGGQAPTHAARLTRAGKTHGKPRAASRDRALSSDVIEGAVFIALRVRRHRSSAGGGEKVVYSGCCRFARGDALLSGVLRATQSVCRWESRALEMSACESRARRPFMQARNCSYLAANDPALRPARKVTAPQLAITV